MHRIGTFVVGVLFVLASTLPAGAQSIRESAERLARQPAAGAGMQAAGARKRSAVRTWAGVGIAVGSLVLIPVQTHVEFLGEKVPGSERIHWGGMSAALAGATGGVLLATVWSDVPVMNDVQVGAAPGGFRVGAGIGW